MTDIDRLTVGREFRELKDEYIQLSSTLKATTDAWMALKEKYEPEELSSPKVTRGKRNEFVVSWSPTDFKGFDEIFQDSPHRREEVRRQALRSLAAMDALENHLKAEERRTEVRRLVLGAIGGNLHPSDADRLRQAVADGAFDGILLPEADNES